MQHKNYSFFATQELLFLFNTIITLSFQHKNYSFFATQELLFLCNTRITLSFQHKNYSLFSTQELLFLCNTRITLSFEHEIEPFFFATFLIAAQDLTFLILSNRSYLSNKILSYFYSFLLNISNKRCRLTLISLMFAQIADYSRISMQFLYKIV